eukprot:Opistho-2@27367
MGKGHGYIQTHSDTGDVGNRISMNIATSASAIESTMNLSMKDANPAGRDVGGAAGARRAAGAIVLLLDKNNALYSRPITWDEYDRLPPSLKIDRAVSKDLSFPMYSALI